MEISTGYMLVVKWRKSPCDPNTYFLAMWNIQQQRTYHVASILLCSLYITSSTNTAVALVVNQEVIVYLPGEAASHPQFSTWCLVPNSVPHTLHQQTWKHEWREFSNSFFIAGITATILKFLQYSSNVKKRFTLWRACASFIPSCVNIKYTRRMQIKVRISKHIFLRFLRTYFTSLHGPSLLCLWTYTLLSVPSGKKPENLLVSIYFHVRNIFSILFFSVMIPTFPLVIYFIYVQKLLWYFILVHP